MVVGQARFVGGVFLCVAIATVFQLDHGDDMNKKKSFCLTTSLEGGEASHNAHPPLKAQCP